jgi:nucleotide-binding universal stress UspA family protein
MSDIVVGYDGTACGHAALDFACEAAAGFGDRVLVAYGFQPYQGAGEIGTQRELMRETGRRLVDEGTAEARERGVEAEAVLLPERPAAALAGLAEERQARMIVVGTYGESPIKGAILGSTPHKLVQIAAVPVVVVPADPSSAGTE